MRQRRRQHILMTKMRYAGGAAPGHRTAPDGNDRSPQAEGEDVMRLTYHAVPTPSEDLLRRFGGTADRRSTFCGCFSIERGSLQLFISPHGSSVIT